MPDDGPDTGRGAMPGWAARHLAEAAAAPAPAPSPEVTPRAPGRHRYGRRLHPEPHRLRGWALATAAVAAAVGTVPLAVASLARQDDPLPRVETFPVVSPVDVGDPASSRPAGTAGSTSRVAPGPDAAATLPPLTGAGSEADVVSPRVAPTAAGRPWHAEPRTTEEARIPRARPPRAPQRPPSTSVTPTTDPAPGDGEEPRENPGGGTTSPRESTPTTTTTTPSDDTPSRRPGLLGGAVQDVSGLLH